MTDSIVFADALYYVILGTALSYLYKAAKQIINKDISFYKEELYTDQSVEKWAVADGILKAITASVCIVYAVLCLLGHDQFWYVIVAFAVNITMYLVLYRRILVRKENYTEIR